MPVDNFQIGKCRAAEIFADAGCAELLAEYDRECALSMLGPIAPRMEMYAALEDMGRAQCFGAYRNGSLCGCAFVLVSPVPHYRGKFASVESLFVASDAREGGLGGKLMEAIEAFALDAGCGAIFYSAPVGSRLSKLLRLSWDKYAHTNEIFCRRLA